MKKLNLALFSLLLSVLSFSQNEEIAINENGLIYNENTMNQLSHIVDSLNLYYKTCDLNKTFISLAQNKGHYISLTTSKKNIRQAKKDLKQKITLENFIKKYPQSEIEKDVFIVKTEYEYNGEKTIEFSKIDFEYGYDYSLSFDTNLENYEGNLNGNWIYKIYKNGRKSRLSAFFLPEGLVTKKMSEQYTRMIGYADCLIDTTTQKMKDNLKVGDFSLPPNWQELSKNQQKKLLEKLRGMRVIGYCSMDNSPRIHAFNIAQLAAETNNWEIFLKAHLDIMNDRFARASDGSYAWEKRKTYLKEVEELNINVHDLVLGISLRIGNPAQNHYFGSIGRIGRALSESKDQNLIEKTMLSMIEDQNLDDYNRLIIAYLFQNYNSYLEQKERQIKNVALLKEKVKTLPAFINSKFDFYEIED